MMNFRRLKKELYYLRKSFFEFHRPVQYTMLRFFYAKKILKSATPLDRAADRTDLSIHLLVCSRDILMMCWSLASYYAVSKSVGKLYIHNDGSLTKNDITIITKLFPQATIVKTELFVKQYESELSVYPQIYRCRLDKRYVYYKKLIDQYFVSSAPIHLIIDSDLLWFLPPTELERAYDEAKSKSLMMPNLSTADVYFKGGEAMPKNFAMYNSGIVMFHRNNFNLTRLEDFLSRVDGDDPRNHFIEQGAFAYCLDFLLPLPLDRYHIKGEINNETVVKHYTSPRRPLFYIEGVKLLKNKLIKYATN
ncbi:MAG: hypothetical protein PHW95_00615 [Patescibacteria group bacterium]|nr:hypothetical protein [Patescibacteria group bacterium]